MSIKVNPGYGVTIDERSVKFAEAAQRRAAEKNISYETAMRDLRSEGDPSASYAAVDEIRKRATAKGSTFAEAQRELRGEGNPTVISFAVADSSTIYVAHVQARDGGQPEIILAIGSNSGLHVGDKLACKRPQPDVLHPVTGKVVRSMSKPMGDIEVTSVDGSSAVAKPLNAADIQVGDIAERITQPGFADATTLQQLEGTPTTTGTPPPAPRANVGAISVAHVVQGNGGRMVVLSDGANRGLKIGDRLACSRNDLDQDQFQKTGMVSVKRIPLGQIEVTDVQSTWAIAKPVNAPDLRTGDSADPIRMFPGN